MSASLRISILLVAGLLIVGLSIVFWRDGASPRKIVPLGIRFAALTNGPSKARVVECIVSNSNDRAIWFWPTASQIKSNGEWPEGYVMLPVQYTELKPKKTTRFTVVCPTNAEVWRVPLLCVLPASKKEWVDQVIQQNISALYRRTALPGLQIGRGYSVAWTNYSPEIFP